MTAESSFWMSVDVAGPGGCWPWLGAKLPKGYGWLRVRGVFYRAHRYAWAAVHGPIPDGAMICHRCDNPPCCNPAHLWLGDAASNNADREAKGRTRLADQTGEANGNHVLTTEDVERVKVELRMGATNRALGERYGVHHSQISNIRRGRSWSNVIDLFA